MPDLRTVNWVSPVNPLHSLNRGRLLWYLALQNSDGHSVRDLMGGSVGSGYTGAFTNNTSAKTSGYQRGTTRQGGIGQLLFDGVDDYIDSKSASLANNLTGGFSAAVWFNTITSANQMILNKLNSSVGSSPGWGIYIQEFSGNIIIGATIQSGGSAYSNPNFQIPVTDGLYHRVVFVVVSANSTLLYLDGKQIATDTGHGGLSSWSSTQNLFVGYPSSDGYGYFLGGMDDICVSNRAWSATEVSLDYDLSRLGYPGVLNRIGSRVFAPGGGATGNRRRRTLLAYTI